MRRENTNANTEEVEAALASLRPRSSRLDRDEMMYLAGKASPRDRTLGEIVWPSATAAAMMLALVFGMLLYTDAPQGQNARAVADRSDPTEPSAQSTDAESVVPDGAYWAVRNRMLANEVSDAWLQASTDERVTTQPETQLRVGSRMQLDQLLDPNQTHKEQS